MEIFWNRSNNSVDFSALNCCLRLSFLRDSGPSRRACGCIFCNLQEWMRRGHGASGWTKEILGGGGEPRGATTNISEQDSMISSSTRNRSVNNFESLMKVIFTRASLTTLRGIRVIQSFSKSNDSRMIVMSASQHNPRSLFFFFAWKKMYWSL